MVADSYGSDQPLEQIAFGTCSQCKVAGQLFGVGYCAHCHIGHLECRVKAQQQVVSEANERLAKESKRANDQWMAACMERESAEYWKKQAATLANALLAGDDRPGMAGVGEDCHHCHRLPTREQVMDIEKIPAVDFESLVGEHELDAVDESIIQIKQWDWSDSLEDANVIRFRLDGKVYTAVEDPSDGYRSSMEKLFVSEDNDMKNTFAPVKVLARIRTEYEYGGTAEVLQLLDMKNGKVILECGTDNTDDYYPSFVASWKPENMAVNSGK
jgi:hypothetical protein